jgi:glycosyltransferase involved in cell wall biosynthesis
MMGYAMRLAVINITGGGLSGGYKKYLINMLPRLVEHKEIEALLCIYPGNSHIPFLADRTQAKEYFVNHMMVSTLFNIPAKRVYALLNEFEPDVIFIPADRYIKFGAVPVVNMLRNMEPHISKIQGDMLHAAIRKKVQKHVSCRAIRLADQTIAVSNFVECYLKTELKIPGDKVSKVYHGVNLLRDEKIARPSVLPIGSARDFLFTCGSIRPARGLEDLVEALSNARIKKLGLKLVIAGAAVSGMQRYRAALERLIASRGLERTILWAGNLNDEEMRWCFCRCRLFIMTSRIEACPNVALEAMAARATTIAADNPPLPEIFSDCASYYRPGDGDSLAQAILDGLAINSDGQAMLSGRSKARSLKFSWDLTADETVSVLKKALNPGKRRGLQRRHRKTIIP